jgi:adenine-specific DNA methylase
MKEIDSQIAILMDACQSITGRMDKLKAFSDEWKKLFNERQALLITLSKLIQKADEG